LLNIFEVLNIEKNEISTKLNCTITLNKTELKDFMVEYDNRFEVPGIIDIYFPELEDFTQIVTPYKVISIIKNENYKESNSEYELMYSANDRIIHQEYVDTEINLGLLNSMLDGRLKYIKDPETFLGLLNKALPKSDLVHLELILSNMFRDNESGDPCRFTGDYTNCEQIGVTRLAKMDSWLSAMTFQNIDVGINRALYTGAQAKLNPIEKVLTEDFDNL
jgi:hypothetical protein